MDSFSANTFEKLDTTGRGFHGIEYVLFSVDKASDLTKQQLDYLHVAVEDLEANAKGLLAAWSGNVEVVQYLLENSFYKYNEVVTPHPGADFEQQLDLFGMFFENLQLA